jgi:hypothetical protein
MSMDGAGFDTPAKCVDVLEMPDVVPTTSG